MSIHCEDDLGVGQLQISDKTPNATTGEIGPVDFQMLKLLGKGGYGKVFLVKKLKGKDKDSTFAMKVQKKSCISKCPKAVSHAKAERNILELVKHPFIVEMKYAFQTDTFPYVILEYMGGGDLFAILEKEVRFTEKTAQYYLAEIALAIEYLHSKGVIYRDLKPENILFSTGGHTKLADFGLCKEAMAQGSVTHTYCGTMEYMAPEIVKECGHGKAVDWWSFGILMYDMLTGGPPFKGETKKNVADKILKAPFYFARFITPEARCLLKKLIVRDTTKRLGSGPEDAMPIKEHCFFYSINWDDCLSQRDPPPFRFEVMGPHDVSWFPTELTKQTPEHSHSNDKPEELSNVEKDAFKGFTYVAPTD